MVVGIVPRREFPERSKPVSAVSPPRALGMLPETPSLGSATPVTTPFAHVTPDQEHTELMGTPFTHPHCPLPEVTEFRFVDDTIAHMSAF